MSRLFFIFAVLLVATPLKALTRFPAAAELGASPAGTSRTPSSRIPRAEKKAVFEQAKVPKTHRRYYVIDRRVPRELGGSNDFSNLQLQSKPEAKAKDRIEKYLLQRVRKGEITLEEAQREVQDWKRVSVK